MKRGSERAGGRLVEELLEVGRLLSPGAALGEGVDDEVVVVDEQRRLVLEGRVLPRESLGEELLDLTERESKPREGGDREPRL